MKQSTTEDLPDFQDAYIQLKNKQYFEFFKVKSWLSSSNLIPLSPGFVYNLLRSISRRRSSCFHRFLHQNGRICYWRHCRYLSLLVYLLSKILSIFSNHHIFLHYLLFLYSGQFSRSPRIYYRSFWRFPHGPRPLFPWPTYPQQDPQYETEMHLSYRLNSCDRYPHPAYHKNLIYHAFCSCHWRRISRFPSR